MDVLDIPVCPGCGAPAVGDVRCSNCGTRLAGVQRMPTRREWELSQPAPGDPGWGDAPAAPARAGLLRRLLRRRR
jgi:tRNA(Ile2) C34 agmatinyltransferase TiaS